MLDAYPEDKEAEASLRIIANWNLLGTHDNVLDALLHHRSESLAIDFMGTYEIFLQKELLLSALTDGNTTFMRKAQMSGAFPKMLFADGEVISVIIGQL